MCLIPDMEDVKGLLLGAIVALYRNDEQRSHSFLGEGCKNF